MPHAVDRQRNTARVKRGYFWLLKAICEDTDYQLLDPQAPWLRGLGAGARRDAQAALRYMKEQTAAAGMVQLDHELRRGRYRTDSLNSPLE